MSVNINVLGKNILVKETLTKIPRKVILTGDASSNLANDMAYTRETSVKQIGAEVQNIPLNSHLIFKSWAEPLYTEIVEGKEGDSKVVRFAIYDSEVVIGYKEK